MPEHADSLAPWRAWFQQPPSCRTEGIKGAAAAGSVGAIAGLLLGLGQLLTVAPGSRVGSSGVPLPYFALAVLVLDATNGLLLGATAGFLVGAIGHWTRRYCRTPALQLGLAGAVLGAAFGTLPRLLDPMSQAWAEIWQGNLSGPALVGAVARMLAPGVALGAGAGLFGGYALGAIVDYRRRRDAARSNSESATQRS